MFQRMLEGVDLPLMVVDGGGRIRSANIAAQRFTGYSRREMVGSPLRALCAPYERNRYIFDHLGSISQLIDVDIDLRTKSGATFLANISFAPFIQSGSRHLLLILRDVTSRRLEEGQVREKEERYRKLLEERNRLEAQLVRSSRLACLGEIAAGIAHEINNPLGIILGFAQDLLDELSEESALWEPLKIIEQETARCVEVVKSLLDYARLRPPQIAEVEIGQLLDDALALLKPRIRKNLIEIKRTIKGEIPPLAVDPDLMRQALVNLMINAVQAMPYGGILTIDAEMTHTGEPTADNPQVRISVGDTGQGIPSGLLARIFDPFFTTKGSKGTGLGLSVSQRIIEDHFGKIEVQSEEGKGTTCHVWLPISDEKTLQNHMGAEPIRLSFLASSSQE